MFKTTILESVRLDSEYFIESLRLDSEVCVDFMSYYNNTNYFSQN